MARLTGKPIIQQKTSRLAPATTSPKNTQHPPPNNALPAAAGNRAAGILNSIAHESRLAYQEALSACRLARRVRVYCPLGDLLAQSGSLPRTDDPSQTAVPARRIGDHPLRGTGVWMVIPCYKVRAHILDVLAKVPSWVDGVVLVDDKCPQQSVAFAAENWSDTRLHTLYNEKNLGVGGAVLAGYAHAAKLGAQIIVKVDGDDQMDLRMMPALVAPIVAGLADYTKGNRFSSLSHVHGMPPARIFGNSMLSLMSKASTGYWNMFDPTNGYTAIEGRVAAELAGKTIARRYFFESDLLYHLGTIRAVVKDIPMRSRYGSEESSLRIFRVILPFLYYHARNSVKRFIGQYLVRDFSVASVEVIAGVVAITIGAWVGLDWLLSRPDSSTAASAGVVMAAVAPFIIGVQFLLSALNFDVLNVPKEPIHKALRAMDALVTDGFEADGISTAKH
jgi:dolichol-phosphate mannosyltransferase